MRVSSRETAYKWLLEDLNASVEYALKYYDEGVYTQEDALDAIRVANERIDNIIHKQRKGDES